MFRECAYAFYVRLHAKIQAGHEAQADACGHSTLVPLLSETVICLAKNSTVFCCQLHMLLGRAGIRAEQESTRNTSTPFPKLSWSRTPEHSSVSLILVPTEDQRFPVSFQMAKEPGRNLQGFHRGAKFPPGLLRSDPSSYTITPVVLGIKPKVQCMVG